MPLIDVLQFVLNHPLNRNRRIRALLDFLKWQVGSRLLPGSVLHDWIGGARFLVRRGQTGLTGNIYTGLHEFNEMGFVLHFLRPDDLFVDIGANVGSYSLLACAAAGARGIAIEPVPATHQKLLENARINHLDARLECLNLGLSDAEGEIHFTADNDTTNHALAPGEQCEHSVLVRTTTLDRILSSQDESRVIAGAEATLAKPGLRAAIIEINASAQLYGAEEGVVPQRMREAGFRMFLYDPLTRTLAPTDRPNPRTGNALFVRDEDYVRQRLQDARRFTVCGLTL